MSLIHVEGLSVSYGARMVLSDVSLRIEPNEIVTIVGPNGSGKTSLLRAIIGAVKPLAGSIVHASNLKIGYVPQKLHIDDTLPITVSRFLKLPGGVAVADIDYALKQAGVPELKKEQLSQLSGGQFQRVLLARALIGKPDLLLLDEATQGLDQRGSASFYQQIETVRQATGCAVLMISHELHVVMSASDRVICLNGHVCCEGAPALVASGGLDGVPLFESASTTANWETWHGSKHSGPVLRPVNISSTVVISLNAAINGVGMALAHTSLFETASAAGHLVRPYDGQIKMRERYFVNQPWEKEQTAATRAFLEWLDDQLTS